MGAKAWFIAYFDDDPKKVLAASPELDRQASRKLAEHLLPDTALQDGDDGTLDHLAPEKSQIFVGSFGGLRIVAHNELANDFPSKIDRRWFDPTLGRNAYVHATHSSVDWLAFGLWQDGQLVRSLSVNSENGVLEQIGTPLAFEMPYWAGKVPVAVEKGEEPYPLPFHPLELGDAAMLGQLGFQFEGQIKDWICDPGSVPIATYSMPRRWSWKFW